MKIFSILRKLHLSILVSGIVISCVLFMKICWDMGHYFYWKHHRFTKQDSFEVFDFSTKRWGWRAPIQDLISPPPKGFVLDAPEIGSKPPIDLSDLGGVPENSEKLFWRYPETSKYFNNYRTGFVALGLCLGFCLMWYFFKIWITWLVKI